MMIKKIILLTVCSTLTACAIFNSKSKQLAISGKFKIRMDSGAAYNQTISSFPVSGQIAESTPFINNTLLTKGLAVFGLYKNNGMSCSIIWTTLTFSDGTALNNSKGVATSSCYASTPLQESTIITATWN